MLIGINQDRIKTLEHAERAANLHFLDEKGSLGISWSIRRWALD
jgi:hypothetical protein